jgi:hypothetical protein
MPKGVLGVRAYNETYKEGGIARNMTGIRLMYGLSSRLSVWVQGTASNHHDSILPRDLINHTHNGNQTVYYTQNRVYGRRYPYLFNGLAFYAKYRILSLDGQNRHFRVALYAKGSRVRSAHDEAEPNLIDDNSGYGGGLIVTQLYKRLAVTVTGGYVKPQPYYESRRFRDVRLYYGDALNYSLAIGYLIYPRRYTGYEQDNYNLYAEFMGRSYQEAVLIMNQEQVSIQSPYMQAGTYLEGRFGVQRIINSNDRLDLSVTLPLYRRSYARFYPLFTIGWQRYFYFNRRRQQEAERARLKQYQYKPESLNFDQDAQH